MKISKQHLVYFSATNNTRNCLRRIAHTTKFPVVEHNITKPVSTDITILSSSELLIVGVPSYAGRVPQICLPALKQFKGQDTPAIMVCTYGNRDFEDTLLELKDILLSNGFKPIAATALVSQHSIFPLMGEGRPNSDDHTMLADFSLRCLALLHAINRPADLPEIIVKGNFPYRDASVVPLYPQANNQCNACEACAHMCPVGAISFDNLQITDAAKCISCGRCVAICPKCARTFGGELYESIATKFASLHSIPKDNVFYYAE